MGGRGAATLSLWEVTSHMLLVSLEGHQDLLLVWVILGSLSSPNILEPCGPRQEFVEP